MATPRTWITLSRQAWRQNYRSFQALVGPKVDVLPIIKANAYGHGALAAVQVLADKARAGFGVAYGHEALELWSSGYRGRVVVLSNWQSQELPDLLRRQIEVVVWDERSANIVKRIAQQYHLRPRVHLKFDTGTTRIGFLASQIHVVERMRRSPIMNIVGVFSHFAHAEEQAVVSTRMQLQRFTTLTGSVPGGWGSGVARHIACTAAIIRYPEARFGLVRLGIGLYGLWPSPVIQAWARAHRPELQLRPVLSWYARLAQVKIVPAGTSIGYGGTVTVRRPTRIGILPIGYADGLTRSASNRAVFRWQGQPVPVIGRVCMNLTMVDLTRARSARAGDIITLIGDDAPVEQLAAAAGTINYETVTGLQWSNPRYIV